MQREEGKGGQAGSVGQVIICLGTQMSEPLLGLTDKTGQEMLMYLVMSSANAHSQVHANAPS